MDTHYLSLTYTFVEDVHFMSTYYRGYTRALQMVKINAVEFDDLRSENVSFAGRLVLNNVTTESSMANAK